MGDSVHSTNFDLGRSIGIRPPLRLEKVKDRLHRFSYAAAISNSLQVVVRDFTYDQLQGSAGPHRGKHGALYLRRQKHLSKIREIWDSTIRMIGEKIINLRPFRREPRAQKKRPKNFSYLTAPRAEYREIPHRGKPRVFA